MLDLRQSGWIEVICGSMYAGKTEELMRRLNRLTWAKRPFLLFKHEIDIRYGDNAQFIVSHSGQKMKAIPIRHSEEVLTHVQSYLKEQGDLYAVAIDEVQFFDTKILTILDVLANQGIRVIVSGLDKDFRGEPFGIMPQLLTQAEDVTKLTSICSRCGSPATRTQRLVNGVPADYHDSIVLVGATESYEPRCRHCHEIKNPELEKYQSRFDQKED